MAVSNLLPIIALRLKKHRSREFIGKTLCVCLVAVVLGTELSWSWSGFRPVRLYLVSAKLFCCSVLLRSSL